MATSPRTMYFAVKLVAPRVGEPKSRTGAIPAVGTKHACEYTEGAASGKTRSLVIGGKATSLFDGVAGHFTASILDFSDKDDAACKSLAEAEQLVKKKNKAWLADAYDWFVFPAQFEGSGSVPAARPTPKKKSARK